MTKNYNPMSPATPCIAVKQISINFSTGIFKVSASAHRATSSRRVPAANFGSFRNRFTIDDSFTSASFRDGYTNATAVISPVKLSAQKNRPISFCDPFH